MRRFGESADAEVGITPISSGQFAAGSTFSAAGSANAAQRRDAEQLRVGEVLDWWRMEEYEPNRRLRLLAEMKTPGRAWLEFEVEPAAQGSRIRQTAIFDPLGVAGLAYWYALYPLHAVIFRGMLRQIAKRAETGDIG